MRPLLLLALIFLLTNAGFARPPVGDWQSLQDIPRGWQITVVTGFTLPCIFEHASSDELICSPLRRNRTSSDSGEIHVRRDRIREVRVERRDGANTLAGSAFGGGTGAGFGAVAAAGSRGGPAYLFGIFGAMIGAHMAHDTHILRGKVIYRSAPSQKRPSRVA